jgi:hypothetical protein
MSGQPRHDGEPDHTGDAGQAAAGPGRYGRRAVMLGAAAAGAGAAVSLAGGAAPAEAAQAVPVLLGRANKATAPTWVTNSKGDGLGGRTSASGHSGVTGTDTSPGGGHGVTGTSARGFGVSGTSGSDYGVVGTSTSGTGMYGLTSGNNQDGVTGTDISPGGGHGVAGLSDLGTGVYGLTYGRRATAVYGVHAGSDSGYGVVGLSDHGTGVYGQTAGNGYLVGGVVGGDISPGGGYGVLGLSNHGVGVWAGGTPGLQVLGDAVVSGTLSKGGGSFKIDHPLDPAGKYLYHSFVESPDMKNVYDGTVVLDGAGQARVQLPDWFEALNRDYRYQLTAVGAPAPGLHIAAEVSGGAFAIAGGAAGQKVCWQVTGIRQDAWANAHRIPVEATKPAEDQGRYLHPELYGNGQLITALAAPRAHIERLRQDSTARPAMPRPLP